MKVLSLFDGISCGMVALERAGIPVERYDAFEIDKYAVTVSERNYPDIIIGSRHTVGLVLPRHTVFKHICKHDTEIIGLRDIRDIRPV